MNRSLKKISIMLSICLAYQGCTYRAWYEGLREKQKLNCQNLPGVRERQECLDRANSQTYDQYKAEREKRENTNP